MDKLKKTYLLQLTKTLIKPAFGCTEIGVISLVAAAAAKCIKHPIIKVEIEVSSYIYRNVIDVGVPRLGRCGIKGIVAAGLLIKDTSKWLAILESLSKADAQRALSLMESNLIHVKIAQRDVPPVYAYIAIEDNQHNIAEALINREHDHFKYVKLNKRLMPIGASKTAEIGKTIHHFSANDISLKNLYDIIPTYTLKDLSFLKIGIKMNDKLVKHGMANLPNNSYAKTFQRATFERDNIWKRHVLTSLTNAIDARMSGCALPVMSSCDSGDHGLTVSIPNYVYAQIAKVSELKMLQALAFSHCLIAVIKKRIGSLSAYCGSVIAATTAAVAGIGLQRDYSLTMLNNLINLCITSFAGAICDGAKNSCTWKILSAFSGAFVAMDLVEQKTQINFNEGITNQDAFITIEGLGEISDEIKGPTNNAIVKTIQKYHK